MSFYKSNKWTSKRPKILRRDGYECQECKRYGKTTDATTVHHIIPLTWCVIHNIALALANINLISFCDKCHDKMHDRTSNKLTALGITWVRRMGQIGIEWIEKYAGEW